MSCSARSARIEVVAAPPLDKGHVVVAGAMSSPTSPQQFRGTITRLGLGIDITYGPQEPEWEAVLVQVRDIDDAFALSTMFEYRDDVLFANELPADALVTEDTFLSERGFASFLAEHLNSLDGVGRWTYMDLYRPTRGTEGTQERVDSLVERCRAGGVELHHRPQPPKPWRVVVSQLACDADLAAFAMLASGYTANSWPIGLAADLAMPRQVADVATSEQMEDFVARCRRAGVVLRPREPD